MVSNNALVEIISMPYPVYDFFARLRGDDVPRFKLMLRDVANWTAFSDGSFWDELLKRYIEAAPSNRVNDSAEGTIALARTVSTLRTALETIVTIYHLYRGAAHFNMTDIVIVRGQNSDIRLLAITEELFGSHRETVECVMADSELGKLFSEHIGSPDMSHRDRLKWLTEWFNDENTPWLSECLVSNSLCEWMNYAQVIKGYHIVCKDFAGEILTLALLPNGYHLDD